MVFPKGKRYFVSSDRIDLVNGGGALFLRLDMPGHIKHRQGNTFSEIYLSYLTQRNNASDNVSTIPSSAFWEDFVTDEQFNYRRDGRDEPPSRFIRPYRLRDPESGRLGPWLAGMTLEPSVVHEAWCHQRGYVCMIEEIGGRPVAAGGAFGAAFIVGYFDSIDQMHEVYDAHKGFTGLDVSAQGWTLVR